MKLTRLQENRIITSLNQNQSTYTNEQIHDVISNMVDRRTKITIGSYDPKHEDCLVYFEDWEKYAISSHDGGVIQINFDKNDQNLSISFRNSDISSNSLDGEIFDYQQIMDDKSSVSEHIVQMVGHLKKS